MSLEIKIGEHYKLASDSPSNSELKDAEVIGFEPLDCRTDGVVFIPNRKTNGTEKIAVDQFRELAKKGAEQFRKSLSRLPQD